MNINRKIQLSAAAVIANGALALGLLSPGSALATTCGPIQSCDLLDFGGGLGGCVATEQQWCTNVAPAGCTYWHSTCDSQFCDTNYREVTCFYKSS
jgi:hypothetical protein